jgi:hypothetical protein
LRSRRRHQYEDHSTMPSAIHSSAPPPRDAAAMRDAWRRPSIQSGLAQAAGPLRTAAPLPPRARPGGAHD